MNKPSLRDIKKEVTSRAIANAAFELARERGMDNFVVEDIVQRAGYSRRTFANHFTCKEEAVAMAAVYYTDSYDAERVIVDLIDGSVPIDVLQQLLETQFTAELLRKLRDLVLLAKQHPSLDPYILNVFRVLQTAAQETLQQIFLEHYPEGYIHLLVGGVYGAILPVVDGSINVLLPGEAVSGDSKAIAFEQYMETIFGYLRNGF